MASGLLPLVAVIVQQGLFPCQDDPGPLGTNEPLHTITEATVQASRLFRGGTSIRASGSAKQQ